MSELISPGLPTRPLVPPRRLRLRRVEAHGGESTLLRHQLVDLAGEELDVRADFANVFADCRNLNEADRHAGQNRDGRKANRKVKLKVGEHFLFPLAAGARLLIF